MKPKLLLVFLFSFTLFVTAQNKVIDSLTIQLKNAKSDIVKAKTLNTIANEYKTTNPKLMLEYANKALLVSKKIGFKIEEGNSYHHIGNANIILGNYALALDNFSKAQTIFENEMPIGSKESLVEFKEGLARANASIGYVFVEQSNYAKGIMYYFKALKIYEQTNNLEKLSKIYNNIGVIYKSQTEYFKALIYYEKCLVIQEKLNDKNIGTTTNNIGLVYLEKKDFTKAVQYFNKAKTYFDKYPNPYALADLNYNYGYYYKEIKNVNKAIEYTNIALNDYNEIDNKFGIAKSYANLGAIYFDLKQYDEALICTNKGLMIAKDLKILDQIQTFEKTISEIYEKQNNLEEALKHYKLFSATKDSVANAETVKNTIKAEMNFEFDRKEMLQNEELEKREIVFNEQAKSTRLKIFFSIFSALLVSGVAFLIYNRAQLKKQLTLEKELAIYEQKALHLQMNPHFIFNCLGSISSFIVKNSTDAAIKYLAKFSKLMRLTLEYSKEALIPIDKEIENLQNYLELEQLRFNDAFQFKIFKCNEIEDDVALPPLLLQPFIENAIIHGINPKVKTGFISLEFFIKKNSLICIVTDNGIGINRSKALKENLVTMHKSMAMDITKKRLEMVEAATAQEAKVTIEELEEKGEIKGTKVTVVLPLQYLSLEIKK
jgi:tetratricopeptide (TPR) repeat protein